MSITSYRGQRCGLGRQLCVQTSYSGLWISLLTVSKRPVDEQVVFRVDTGACNPRPGESAIWRQVTEFYAR